MSRNERKRTEVADATNSKNERWMPSGTLRPVCNNRYKKEALGISVHAGTIGFASIAYESPRFLESEARLAFRLQREEYTPLLRGLGSSCDFSHFHKHDEIKH